MATTRQRKQTVKTVPLPLPESLPVNAPTTPTEEGVGFINDAELLRRIPVCKATLKNWRTRGWLPYIKAGARILYHWPTVRAALLRRQREAAA